MTDLVLDRGACHVCRLMTQSDFVRFCRERGVRVSPERLWRLERLGVFLPFFRIRRPDIVVKVEYVDEGRRYRDLGQLQDGESWTGDTQTELAAFSCSPSMICNWRESTCLWGPRDTTDDQAAEIERGESRRRHEAYYSRFQVHHLQQLLNALTLSVELECLLTDDGAARLVDSRGRWTEMAAATVASAGKEENCDRIGPLCQLISDRYYPRTQTDERRFTLSADGRWDWNEYVQGWDAHALVTQLEFPREELARLYERVSIAQGYADPLENWAPLVRFVALEKRKQLKGSALRAMTLREMAQMIRLLYLEAFDEALAEPNDVGRSIIHRIPDIDPRSDPLGALELVANDFGVTPKPQLVLFVEGATEEAVIPLIVDRLYGTSLSHLGIELVNLGGVSNAAGGKENPFSALWRLIDYLHHHQTIAVVLADNEALAGLNLASGLPKANSTFLRDRRATRREYIRVWRRSFEFDNFSCTEIAGALSQLGGLTIGVEAVRDCYRHAGQENAGRPIPTLTKLFESRTGAGLDKRALGKRLVEMTFVDAYPRNPLTRPISPFLKRIVTLASRNHQPSTTEMWAYNQRTGYLGTLKPGAASRRKELFGGSRERRPKRDATTPGP